MSQIATFGQQAAKRSYGDDDLRHNICDVCFRDEASLSSTAEMGAHSSRYRMIIGTTASHPVADGKQRAPRIEAAIHAESDGRSTLDFSSLGQDQRLLQVETKIPDGVLDLLWPYR